MNHIICRKGYESIFSWCNVSTKNFLYILEHNGPLFEMIKLLVGLWEAELNKLII